jgi:precorrin isomerase
MTSETKNQDGSEMTREMAIARLKAEQDNGDKEAAHGNADAVLVDLLSALGYDDVVDEWAKVGKWYA